MFLDRCLTGSTKTGAKPELTWSYTGLKIDRGVPQSKSGETGINGYKSLVTQLDPVVSLLLHRSHTGLKIDALGWV